MTPSPYRQSNQSHQQRWSSTDDIVVLSNAVRSQQSPSMTDNRGAVVNPYRASFNLESVVHFDRSAASTAPHRHRFLTIPIALTDQQPPRHSTAVSSL